MRVFSAVLKLMALALLTIILLPFQLIVMAFSRGEFAYFLPFLWEKSVCRIFQIKVLVHGTPALNSQTMFVGNHVSYLDIPVLGSVLPVSFVAKSDVADWPVFGFLAKMQQTAFISRERMQAALGKNALNAMIVEGKSFVIFPEGTSSDGRDVLSFKSSLFAAARPPLSIQPFSQTILKVDGKIPDEEDVRNIYAWHNDMPKNTDMLPHLWDFAKSRGATIKISFHKPFEITTEYDRKELAKRCHEAVSIGVEQGNRLALQDMNKI